MQKARPRNANEDVEAGGTALTFNPRWTMVYYEGHGKSHTSFPQLGTENVSCILTILIWLDSSNQNPKYIFPLLHLGLFISLDCFGVEISAVEFSNFSQI